MRFAVRRVATFAFVLLLIASPAKGGAFLLPQGTGQVIVGLGLLTSSRHFQTNGVAVPAPSWRKANVGGYLEYGWTSRLTIIAAPAVSGWSGAGIPGPIGSDGSAIGARYGLATDAHQTIAVQALLQPPLGHESPTRQEADGGARAFASDLRLLYGRCFEAFGWPMFVSLEPGGRLRTDPMPHELRFDGTLGLRPAARWMVLVQTFDSYAFAAPTMPPSLAFKLAGSIAYQIAPSWSVQVGAVRTVAGSNTSRDVGPTVAVWYRF